MQVWLFKNQRFLQKCRWIFRSYGIRRCDVGWVFSYIPKDHSALISKVKHSIKKSLFNLMSYWCWTKDGDMQYVAGRPHVGCLSHNVPAFARACNINICMVLPPDKELGYQNILRRLMGLPVQRYPTFLYCLRPSGTILGSRALSILHNCVLRFNVRLSIPSATWINSCTFLLISLCANLIIDLNNTAYFFKPLKNAKSDISIVMSVCASFYLSVCPHGTIWLPMDGFSWSLIPNEFSKICWGNLISIQNDKNNGNFVWRSTFFFFNLGFVVPGIFNHSNKTPN